MFGFQKNKIIFNPFMLYGAKFQLIIKSKIQFHLVSP